MRNKIFKPLFCILIVALGFSLKSCNEEFSKIIPDNQGGEVDVQYGTPKVLLLVVDGARGESVRTANITNLNEMVPHAIYSFVSLSEENALDIQSNWTNIFTGVNYAKHGVRDADFSTNKLDAYPLVFKRIKAVNENAKMSLISPSQKFITNYGKDVQSQLATSDADVTSKVINQLKEKDIDFITGHFTNVEKTGLSVGFDNQFPAYKSSIEAFDKQVGDIMKALESRESVENESWMVIITSSQGGEFEIPESQNDNTIFSNSTANTFTIIYTPKFKSKYIGKPFIGNKFIGDFTRFTGSNYAQLDTGDNSIFDMGENDFTVEIKIKKNKGPNNNYRYDFPSIIGKRKHWQSDWDREPDGIGWVIHLAGESWIFNGRGLKGYGEIKADKNMNRGTWNSIAFTASTQDGQRKIRLYTNGELSKEGDITGWGSIVADAKFRIGYLQNKNGWQSDAYLADVKIWKAALSPDVIKQFSCEIGVSPNHPYINYLAGYWPLTGTNHKKFYDESPFGNHLNTGSEGYQILRLNDYICAPSSSTLGSMVPRTIDVATQIISWLKVPRQTSWDLDGRVWIDK